jgi:hypothetical protein
MRTARSARTPAHTVCPPSVVSSARTTDAGAQNRDKCRGRDSNSDKEGVIPYRTILNPALDRPARYGSRAGGQNGRAETNTEIVPRVCQVCLEAGGGAPAPPASPRIGPPSRDSCDLAPLPRRLRPRALTSPALELAERSVSVERQAREMKTRRTRRSLGGRSSASLGRVSSSSSGTRRAPPASPTSPTLAPRAHHAHAARTYGAPTRQDPTNRQRRWQPIVGGRRRRPRRRRRLDVSEAAGSDGGSACRAGRSPDRR